MLSIELIRRNPDQVRKALARRGEEGALEGLLALDERRRKVVGEGDALRTRRNDVSKQVGELMRDPAKRAQAEGLREEMRKVGDRLKEIDEEVVSLEKELRAQLLTLPNLPREDVPDGLDSSANVMVKQEGTPRKFDFTPKPHWELAETLGLVDMERGAKLSGARFYLFLEMGARLQRALISWMLDLHRTRHGYKEFGVPFLVKPDVMEGSGNLPKFRDNLYHDNDEDLWLIPTAEVPLTGLYRDEILEPGTLPLKYMAHSPCFRKERTAAGRDVRGIKRVHQFEKVEMYQFVEPEKSDEALESLRNDAEDVCRGLGIPYRVLKLCAGDIGFQSAKSYDLEMWAPGCEEWLEVSSCSTCADFQARRANLRFRRQLGGKVEFLHTLNGSGLAVPRVIISIIENFQQADGSVVVPEVLRLYLGTDRIMPVNK